eukprot:118910_1
MDAKMLLIGKLEDGDTNLQPMTFKHPKHGNDCCYLIGKSNIYEMQTFEDDGHCSLFIDDYVSESNTIYLINKMDPIYLLIPSLLKNRKKSHISENYCASPLDQLLDAHQMDHILSKIASPQDTLSQICNVQEIDDGMYCVLDDDKVISFLDSKLKTIEQALTTNPSISINIDATNDALCILNEYIPHALFEQLCQKYKLSTKRVMDPRKRKISDLSHYDDGDPQPNHKKRKIQSLNENINQMNVSNNNNYNTVRSFNDDSMISSSNPSAKAVPKSRALSKLSKANTKGMKSMMSYFGKKK